MTQAIENIGGEYENRTRVHGFAIRCVTTPPTRHLWSDPAFSDHVRGVQWGFWRRWPARKWPAMGRCPRP